MDTDVAATQVLAFDPGGIRILLESRRRFSVNVPPLQYHKSRGEITIKEIEEAAGANRNTIKAHAKSLAGQHLTPLGKGRGARYMITKS